MLCRVIWTLSGQDFTFTEKIKCSNKHSFAMKLSLMVEMFADTAEQLK